MSILPVAVTVIPPFAVARSRTVGSHGQSLLWGNAAQGHIWAVVIVFPHPHCVA